MKLLSFITLGLVTSVFSHAVPLTSRDINSVGSTQDIPEVEDAVVTLTTAFKEASNTIAGITEDSLRTSINKWVDAGKIINQALINASEQLQGSKRIGLFQIGKASQPLQTLGRDLNKLLSSPSIKLAQNSKTGKEGIIELIKTIEPGLKVFIVSVFSQFPSEALKLLKNFKIKVPNTPAELDKAFEILDRALSAWDLGEFDRYINALKEVQRAGDELAASGILDKILGQPKGTLKAQQAEAAARRSGRSGGKAKPSDSSPVDVAAEVKELRHVF